jgi:hypothetical protein
MWATDTSPSTVSRIKLAAASYPGQPAFVLVALPTWTMGFKSAEQLMQQLGPGFVAIRPDRFVGLIEGAQLLPGTPAGVFPSANPARGVCSLAASARVPPLIPALPSTTLATAWGPAPVILAAGAGAAVASRRWRRRAQRRPAKTCN